VCVCVCVCVVIKYVIGYEPTYIYVCVCAQIHAFTHTLICAIHCLQRVRQKTWLVPAEPTECSLVQRLSPPLTSPGLLVPGTPRKRSMPTQTHSKTLARTLIRRTILGGSWIWKEHNPSCPSKYGIVETAARTGSRGLRCGLETMPRHTART